MLQSGWEKARFKDCWYCFPNLIIYGCSIEFWWDRYRI